MLEKINLLNIFFFNELQRWRKNNVEYFFYIFPLDAVIIKITGERCRCKRLV